MRRIFSLTLFPTLALALSLTLATGSAQAALTQKTSIVESLKVGTPGTQFIIDQVGAANETPQRMNTASGGTNPTGFTWGGYEPSAVMNGTTPSSVKVLDYSDGTNGSNGIFLMYNWAAGQYYYTLFSSAGTNTPDQYVNLSSPYAAITVYIQQNAALTYPVKLRWLLRSNSNSQWYVSSPVALPVPVPTAATLFTTPLAQVSWYAVDSAVSTNLNTLAQKDEVALTYASSTVTPDLSKVDGGGFLIDTGQDVYTTSLKFNRLTWNSSNPPNLKTVSTPSFVLDKTQLVLGPQGSPNPLNGAINIASSNGIPLTVTKIQLNDPSGRFSTGALPALPLTLSGTASTTVTVAWNPPAVSLSDSNSSASLSVTCDAGGVPGTVVNLPIVGRQPKNISIYETFNNGSQNLNMASYRPTNLQAPQATYPPPTAGNTGFRWGGYTNATLAGTGRNQVGFNANRLVFYGGLTDDAHTGGNYHGSYAYTIFDSMGGTSPDYALKLEKIQINPDQAATGQQIRFLIRDSAGAWYLSNTVMSVAATASSLTYLTFDLDTFTWKRVDAGAEGYMNRMAAETQVAIAEPATLAAATPSLNGITGAGIYIETGETSDAQQTAFTPNDMNFIIRPSNNDRLTVKTRNTVSSNTAVVPFKRLGLMQVNCQVTSGMEVALDGLDVTASSVAGLRTLYIYSDPNANGLPDDGQVLTSSTVSGSTVKINFRSPEVVLKGSPKDYALVGVFDASATSQTYTLTVASANWRQNTASGGTGDQIIQTPDPATVSFKVNSVALPDILSNPTIQEFSETWEKVAVGAVAQTPANGTVTGTDVASWTYNFTGGTVVKQPAAFVSNGGSVVGGVETKDMTQEVTPYDAGFFFRHDIPFAIPFDARYIQMVKLDFTAIITSTTQAALSPHFSARLNADYANFGLRLNASSGSSYGLTFYPLTDFDRSFFSVGAGSTAEYAPGNILAYANNNGLGHYQCSLWLAPTFGSPALTTVKLDIKHVESGKVSTWMTQVNGSALNVKSVDLWYGAWANAFFDNVALTEYQYFVNPVKSWTMFE